MRFILVLTLSLAGTAHAWTLNDVSILLPLPQTGAQNLLLDARADGGKGVLLPYHIYENLPRLIMGADRREVYDLLRVVAIRIDPCFREKNGPTACRKQIRMVWQPVLAAGVRTITADAAMHTFFDLTDQEWDQLLTELAPLAGQNEETLDVHPRIRAQGLAGEHWRNLRSIMLKYAGEKNLTRATSMSVDTLGSIWAFSGVNVKGGVLERIMIPRSHHFAQSVIADISNLNELRLSIRPQLNASPAWIDFVADSFASAQRMGPTGVLEPLRESLRIENPLLEDTGSLDCVSCHIAQSARVWGERRLPQWRWRAEDEAYKTEAANLQNNSVQPGASNRMRAFGYFNDEAVISQRLINESAEVLSQVRGLFRNDCQDLIGRK